MSYFNKTYIQGADSPSVDAFARLRVSNLTTTFDSKQLYDTGSYIWATKTIGNATASFYSNNASVQLNAAGSNSAVIRQTRRRAIYQPGKSQLIVMTTNFSGSSPNVIKQAGYFDNNNGIYFTTTGSSFGVGLRTSTSGTPTDTFISQSDWNIDKMDGTGPSGATVNLTASQILFMDFEWLGSGRIRYGIVQAGTPIYVHQITNINTVSSVYMSSPNQPLRYQIINSGSVPASMLHVCSAVSSEGGNDQNGVIRAASNPNGIAVNANVYCGLMALRLKSTALDSGFIPLNVSTGQTAANVIYEVCALINPTTSSAWTWQDVPNSNMQYATASNSSNTITSDGTKVYSVINVGQNGPSPINFDPTFALGADVDGNQDTLVIAWKGIMTNAANAAVSLVWREL